MEQHEIVLEELMENKNHYLRLKCIALRLRMGKGLDEYLSPPDKRVLVEIMKEYHEKHTRDEITNLFNSLFCEGI